jgi:hypothetical protein
MACKVLRPFQGTISNGNIRWVPVKKGTGFADSLYSFFIGNGVSVFSYLIVFGSYPFFFYNSIVRNQPRILGFAL